MAKRKTKSRADLQERVAVVYGLLVNGCTARQAATICNGDKYRWAVSERTVATYCRAAYAMLAADAKPRRLAELGKAMLRLDLIYRRALAAEDLGMALAATRERIRLLGLAEPEKTAIDHTSAGRPLERTEILIVPRGALPEPLALPTPPEPRPVALAPRETVHPALHPSAVPVPVPEPAPARPAPVDHGEPPPSPVENILAFF